MNKDQIKKSLMELSDHFDQEENDKMALRTYYSDFYISELINEIWSIVVDGDEPNYYSY